MVRKPRISAESFRRLQAVRQGLEAQRSPLIGYYKKIAEMFSPSVCDWSGAAPSSFTVPDVSALYNNTGYKASLLLTDGIQGYGFSRRDTWFREEVDDEELMEHEPVGEWLQALERHKYRQYAASNFYDEARLLTKCVADFATGVMVAREDWARGLTRYETLHPATYLLDDDDMGYCAVLFRDFWLTAHAARARFGEDALPTQIRSALEGASSQYFKFTQVTMPKEQYDLDIGLRETRGKPIYSLIFAAIDEHNPISEGGYEVQNWWGWRWSRALNGGPYGVDSPGMIELPNARQVNGMTREYATLVERLAEPPIKSTPGLFGKINLKPNGITYLDQGEDYVPAMVAGNPQGLAEYISLRERGIQESYHEDFFLILTQAIEAQKTAAEVYGVQGEKAALLSAFFGRMDCEFLQPAHDYQTYAELTSGRFDMPVPEELKGKVLRPSMVSPLAMMQRRYLSFEPTKAALAEILPLAQINPDVMLPLDLEQYVRIVADSHNMDRRVLYDIAQVEKMKKARAEKLAKAEMLAEAQAKAGALKDSASAAQGFAQAQATGQGGVA